MTVEVAPGHAPPFVQVAVMLVEPRPCVVKNPVFKPIVATEALLEAQVVFDVRSWVVPSL